MVKKINEFVEFTRDTYKSKELILQLSKNDFKVRYAGSYLGIIWGFIQPLITVLVYWFVFEVGLRAGTKTDGTPYILWLVTGIVPWFFFSEGLASATSSLIEYSYLVKKVVFRVSILPVVKIFSAFYIHLFFVSFIFIMFFLYRIPIHISYTQVFYYSFCVIFLLVGLVWITSSIVVFLKDVSQVVGIVIQIGFWLIPIVWSPEILPKGYINLFKLNPIYYIVEGYRDTFINHQWFWNRGFDTIYFWVISSVIFVIGALLFRRLKPHFSDVL